MSAQATLDPTPRSGVAAAPTGGLLLVGEDAPGSLLSAVLPGLRQSIPTTVLNPRSEATKHINRGGIGGVVRRRLGGRGAFDRVLGAAEQLEPDVILLIKGRGVTAEQIRMLRRAGHRVACWYPDNVRWLGGDPGAHERLAACDLPIVFAERHAADLRKHCERVAVLPFGYHPGWFPLTDPTSPREGVAFLGTWSPRRERFIRALEGLPLVIAGTGWRTNSRIAEAGDPIVEHDAGRILANAAIGVNLLHPQCAETHNMRTREICAAGALQVTDPGVDGTPLRDEESCLWFHSPEDLRAAVERALDDEAWRMRIATAGQRLIAGDTYEQRGRELGDLLRTVLP